MDTQPIAVLYPSQLAWAKAMGWTRDKEFIVVKCIMCGEDMDRCTCKKDRK